MEWEAEVCELKRRKRPWRRRFECRSHEAHVQSTIHTCMCKRHMRLPFIVKRRVRWKGIKGGQPSAQSLCGCRIRTQPRPVTAMCLVRGLRCTCATYTPLSRDMRAASASRSELRRPFELPPAEPHFIMSWPGNSKCAHQVYNCIVPNAKLQCAIKL